MVYWECKILNTEKDSVHEITADVSNAIAASGIQNGIVVIEAEDTTVGIVRTAGNDALLLRDTVKEMRRLVPARITFQREVTPEDTAGNLKCAFFGNSVSGLVKEGKLLTGDTNGIYFLEYDGPGVRRYHIGVVGE